VKTRAVRASALSVLLTGALAACGGSGTREAPGAVTPSAAEQGPAALVSAPPARAIAAEIITAAVVRVTAARAAGSHGRAAIERRQMEALYSPAALLWLDSAGQPSSDAREALAVLHSADLHGLASEDYQAAALAQEAVNLTGENRSDGALASFDVGLSLHLLRYWRDLHMGRVSPGAVGFRMNAPVDDHDFPAMLRAALSAHGVGAVSGDLAPPLVLYRSLMAVLARYRALEETGGALPTSASARSVKPGAAVNGLAALHARLAMLGDLPAGIPPPSTTVYDGDLVEGVKQFQVRHGLEPDAILGQATLAALAVPVAHRIRQLELALERLRWLPHLDAEGFLAVNIPMFHVWGWEAASPDGAPEFELDVIVGRSLNTQTPVFVDEMSHIIFRPYWNVPPSILRGEILPAMARDPSYLSRNDMEIVAGAGDGATPLAETEENLARLRQGALRVRQRPGPNNSLGLVKFVFPNDDNIYMHGTPAPQLFGRARRDFSHGCVRVADPVMLAEWVLRDQPEWTRERITAAMQSGTSQRVNLTRPLQVILFYLTAVVMPEDGSVRFADDIYGHDRQLQRALARP
jgi:murein L,D-transpeptidase YcbB/YkuD